MILQLEDRWGTLALLEYEHGAREALLALWRAGDLKFANTSSADQEAFIRESAAAYAAQSFRQAKEFFRHAETSSWLVKPLLLYYGMLTAAKAALTFDTADFFLTKPSMKHGLNRIKNTASTLGADSLNVQNVGVFQLARNAIGGAPIAADTPIPIDEILKRLPEVAVAYNLVARGTDVKFTRTKLPWVASSGPSQLFRIVFDLPKPYSEANREELPDAILNEFDLLTPGPAPDINRYVSKSGWAAENDAKAVVERGQPPFLTPTLDGEAALLLPINLNGIKLQFTEIELILMVTFYFSEIARYMPHIWLQLHSGQASFSVLLCQDVLRSCENKFLQLLQKQLVYTLMVTLRGATINPKP